MGGSPFEKLATTAPLETELAQSSLSRTISVAGHVAGTEKLLEMPISVMASLLGVQLVACGNSDGSPADEGITLPAGSTITVMSMVRTVVPIDMFTDPVYTPGVNPVGFTATPKKS